MNTHFMLNGCLIYQLIMPSAPSVNQYVRINGSHYRVCAVTFDLDARLVQVSLAY